MPISHILAESTYYSYVGGQNQHQQINPFDNITDLTSGLKLDAHQHQHDVSMTTPSQKLVLIDTDAGTDDAWAIFMSLAAQRDPSSGFKIVGITTVYGNTDVDNVANNVTRILDTVQETAIPIYKGMSSSLTSQFAHLQQPPYNGHDGFGDANVPKIPTRIEPEHSVEAIIKLAEAHPGQLTLMCLGPLTNLAMALKLRPGLKNLLKEVFILGGNVEGLGNVTPCSEFNFFVDPEAAKVVLGSMAPCPIYILPWETCMKFATSAHDWRMNVLGNMRTAEIELLNKIEAKILSAYPESWLVSDAVLAACLINSNVIKKTEAYHCSVELSGNHTRGMMVVDRSFIEQNPTNAMLIMDVDRTLFESMLIWAAGGPVYDKSA